ncbi:MAG: F0F1 ATP synthase subunit delta [Gammaproteobacteria bacterium]|nr:F0F1 ATP synthase subunit delta [Gammaproteobacteria bacterium]MDJ0870199.1 F0F1 ATP synthase subunit delta [Gammaproteobacteria bacterium]MDJ0890043.1 F0F1 ATP synthase subunit delta [Gammaproteobacteria bacterium]
MAELTTLARPYAVAVFRIAQEKGEVELWSDMLKFLADVASDATMKGLIADPRLEASKLAEVVVDVAGGRLSDTGENLVKVLAEEHGRLGLLPAIAEVYERERAAAEKRQTVEVVSAYAVNPQVKQTISNAMQKRLGCEVELETRVDRSLIGGVVIRAGDTVIDASLRGRLRQLESRLG